MAFLCLDKGGNPPKFKKTTHFCHGLDTECKNKVFPLIKVLFNARFPTGKVVKTYLSKDKEYV